MKIFTRSITYLILVLPLAAGCSSSRSSTGSGRSSAGSVTTISGSVLNDSQMKELPCPDLCFFGVVYRTDRDTMKVGGAFVNTDPETSATTTNDDGSFILSGLIDGNRYTITASYGGNLTGSVIKVAEDGDNRVVSIYLGSLDVEIPTYKRGEEGDAPADGSKTKRSG